MTISERSWVEYIDGLRKINETAAEKMAEYLRTHPTETQEEWKAALDYGYSLASHYGEGAAELACQMYDTISELSDVMLPAAEPAPTATYGEVAKALNGIRKYSQGIDMLASGVSRLVKRTGVDTTMNNAIRDGAEWAWIPHGDTCAFCITLASRGWQKATKEALKGGHAEHIHANCDCTYGIRHDSKTKYEGYDPDKYLKMYDATDGTSTEKINAMRRKQYAKDGEKIRAQKRAAYAKRKEEYLRQESRAAIPPKEYEHNFEDFHELEISEAERNVFVSLREAMTANGYEHGVIIDNGIPGKILTDNEVDKVRLPNDDIKNNHATLLHCHTGTTPPSSIDVRRLVNKKVDRVGVVTYNGDIFIVDVGEGFRPTLEEFTEDEREIRESVDTDMMEQAYKKGWTPDELTYMCIREELYRLCVKYGWTASGGLL